MSDEQKFTLAEAQRELFRLQCEERGHPPDSVLRAGGKAVVAHCDCGAVKWLPHMIDRG